MQELLDLNVPSVYIIPCEYGTCLIGQTDWSITIRLKEHQQHLSLAQLDKTTLALHSQETGHNIHFPDKKVLFKSSYWGPRIIMQWLEISLRTEVINKENGARLSTACSPAYDKLRSWGGNMT